MTIKCVLRCVKPWGMTGCIKYAQGSEAFWEIWITKQASEDRWGSAEERCLWWWLCHGFHLLQVPSPSPSSMAKSSLWKCERGKGSGKPTLLHAAHGSVNDTVDLKGTCTTPTKVFLNQPNLIAFRKVEWVITHGTNPRTSSSVQSLSRVWFFVTPWTAACQASLSITNSESLLKLTSIESVMRTNHLILRCPLLLLPSIFPSIKVFSNESALHIRWPKDWSFSFTISPSNEYSGLISFRMDWLHLFAIQGILKSLLQHHSSKASILWYSAFFIVQLSHPYMTTGKTIALTRQTFVGKVMSLLFNMLSRWLRW